jgi:hypothetical protein
MVSVFSAVGYTIRASSSSARSQSWQVAEYIGDSTGVMGCFDFVLTFCLLVEAIFISGSQGGSWALLSTFVNGSQLSIFRLQLFILLLIGMGSNNP